VYDCQSRLGAWWVLPLVRATLWGLVGVSCRPDYDCQS
jgi:hypothetical protein